MFRAIEFDGFPPFGKQQVKLPPVNNKPAALAEVHVFTGVNGTGKTRLLSVLAALLGNSQPLTKRVKGATSPANIRVTDTCPTATDSRWKATFHAAESGCSWHGGLDANFHTWLGRVPAFAYNGAAYVADTSITAMGAVPTPRREASLSFIRAEADSKELLQAITNLKLQAAMESMGEAHEDSKPNRTTRIVKALESTLSEITRDPFLFLVTAYPNVSLRVSWGNTRLPFDLLPDGLRSIIGWLVHAVVMMDVWLKGNADPKETEAIFLLDEIESHLHPAWQRRILPAFQSLFPKAQVFVATHSPFVIASVNHGWIHPLTMKADGRVTIEEPVPASEGDSYVSVVEDIMGLKEWFDPDTERLLEQFRANRDAAYLGDASAQTKARELATQIGGRSMELGYMMGRELRQMDRQLAKTKPGK